MVYRVQERLTEKQGRNRRMNNMRDVDKDRLLNIIDSLGWELTKMQVNEASTEITIKKNYQQRANEIAGEEKKYKSTFKYILIDEFDNGQISTHALVFKNMFEAINNNTPPLSNINNAYQHTICVNKCFDFGINQVDKKFLDVLSVEKEMYNPDLDVSNEKNIVIKKIEETIKKMYESKKSFIEIGAKWAK